MAALISGFVLDMQSGSMKTKEGHLAAWADLAGKRFVCLMLPRQENGLIPFLLAESKAFPRDETALWELFSRSGLYALMDAAGNCAELGADLSQAKAKHGLRRLALPAQARP